MKSVIPLNMSKVIVIISCFVFSWFSGKLRISSTSGPGSLHCRTGGRARASASGGQINEQKEEVIITEATAKHRSGASTDGDEVAQSVTQSDSSPPRGVLDPLRPVCSSLVERPAEAK